MKKFTFKRIIIVAAIVLIICSPFILRFARSLKKEEPVTEVTLIEVAANEKTVIPSVECFLGIRATDKEIAGNSKGYTLNFEDSFSEYPEEAINDYVRLLQDKYGLAVEEEKTGNENSDSLIKLFDSQSGICLVDIKKPDFFTDKLIEACSGDEYESEIISMYKDMDIFRRSFKIYFSVYCMTEDLETWNGDIFPFLHNPGFEKIDCSKCGGDGECRECYGDGRESDGDGGSYRCSECGGDGACDNCSGGKITTDQLMQYQYFYNPSNWKDCPYCGGDGRQCSICFDLLDCPLQSCDDDLYCSNSNCLNGKVRNSQATSSDAQPSVQVS